MNLVAAVLTALLVQVTAYEDHLKRDRVRFPGQEQHVFPSHQHHGSPDQRHVYFDHLVAAESQTVQYQRNGDHAYSSQAHTQGNPGNNFSRPPTRKENDFRHPGPPHASFHSYEHNSHPRPSHKKPSGPPPPERHRFSNQRLPVNIKPESHLPKKQYSGQVQRVKQGGQKYHSQEDYTSQGHPDFEESYENQSYEPRPRPTYTNSYKGQQPTRNFPAGVPAKIMSQIKIPSMDQFAFDENLYKFGKKPGGEFEPSNFKEFGDGFGDHDDSPAFGGFSATEDFPGFQSGWPGIRDPSSPKQTQKPTRRPQQTQETKHRIYKQGPDHSFEYDSFEFPQFVNKHHVPASKKKTIKHKNFDYFASADISDFDSSEFPKFSKSKNEKLQSGSEWIPINAPDGGASSQMFDFPDMKDESFLGGSQEKPRPRPQHHRERPGNIVYGGRKQTRGTGNEEVVSASVMVKQ